MESIEEKIITIIKLVDIEAENYKNESNINRLENVKSNLLMALGGLQLLESEEEQEC